MDISSLSAALRGALDGVSLGYADDAASLASKALGTKDYGQVLRNYYDQDKQNHPYLHDAGEVVGSIAPAILPGADLGVGGRIAATVYRNPIINGAVSAIGSANPTDPNQTLKNDISAGLTGAVTGGVTGGIGKMVGNKIGTGSFLGKTKPDANGTLNEYLNNGGTVVDYAQANGVPTPGVYQMTQSSNPVSRLTGNLMAGQIANDPKAVNMNNDVLNKVRSTFPTLAKDIAVGDNPVGTDPNHISSLLEMITKNGLPKNYTASDLKPFLDKAIQDYSRGNNPEGDDIANSNLNKLVQSLAPIHAGIEQNANPVAGAVNSPSKYGALTNSIGVLAPIVGYSAGHGLGGLAAAGAIAGGKVGGKIGLQLAGERSLNNSLKAGGSGAISPLLGTAINQTVPAISSNTGGATGETYSTKFNPLDDDTTNQLRNLGFTDDQINQLND